MRVLGIDGGVSGAIAILDDQGGEPEVMDTPVFNLKVGKSTREFLDPQAFKRVLLMATMHPLGIDKILFEKNNGVRGQSAPAAYKFGHTNGQMVGVVCGLGLPYEEIEPDIWKRAMRLTGKGKDNSRELACRLFPSLSHMFARVEDDGRAEAALLAYYELHRRTPNV